jgi:transcriptional regulator with GAF, ATPase, and Fis domain
MTDNFSTLTSDDLQKDFVLQLASMFEGDFSIDWLVEITGLKASTIISILEENTIQGPIRNVKPAVYAFELDSRQQWVNQLGEAQKEQFHRNIASILIREMPEEDTKALLISKHLMALQNDAQDCEWIIRAGDIYAKRLYKDQAFKCFKHVVDALRSQQGENVDRLFIQAALGLSNCDLGKSDPQHFIKIFEEAKGRAKRIREKNILYLLDMHIAIYERLSAEESKSIQRFKAAFAKVEASGDPELIAESSVFRIYFTFWQGLFRDVIDIYERSVPDVQRVPIGSFPTLAAMLVGHCYTMVGQMTHGLGMLDTLRNYCLENGDKYLAAYASSTIAMAMLSIERIEDALSYLKIALKEADESNNLRIKAQVVLLLALVFAHKKNSKEFLKFFDRYTKLSYDLRGNLHLNKLLLEILWHAETMRVQLDAGCDLKKEIDHLQGLNNVFLNGVAFRYQALYESDHNVPQRGVIQAFQKSFKLLEQSGHVAEVIKTQMAMARFYLGIGKEKKARTILEQTGRNVPPAYQGLIPDDLRPLIEKEERENIILEELYSLSEKLTGKGEKNRLIQQIITVANRITGAERGALLLAQEESSGLNFKLRASKNITWEQINSPAFSVSHKLIEKVIQDGKGSISETVTVENGLTFSQDSIRSSICIPIIMEGKVTGVLYHDNRLLGNIFKPSDLKILSLLSILIGLELDREEAWAQVEKNIEREKQVAIYQVSKDNECAKIEGLIGKSAAFLETLSKVTKVAPSDTAVLITGETGVGKNLIASAIHKLSPRCNKPFVIVQCSSLSESLITSELFGHEKGAFTGAVARSIGRFELANGGTIFLDEIGDLSLDIQARLLRVLQSKEFERVGGGKEILTSDFRLIAATNKNLDQQVRAGHFREDLYYRINVFPINVPPLRERRDDIPLLAQHFLDLWGAREKKPPLKFTEQVMQALMHHHWPGNIRELENVIQRGMLSSSGEFFQLPTIENGNHPETRNFQLNTFDENIRQNILEALRLCRGKLYGPGGAAEILQINPSTLASRIKKLGIKKKQWAGSETLF